MIRATHSHWQCHCFIDMYALVFTTFLETVSHFQDIASKFFYLHVCNPVVGDPIGFSLRSLALENWMESLRHGAALVA